MARKVRAPRRLALDDSAVPQGRKMVASGASPGCWGRRRILSPARGERIVTNDVSRVLVDARNSLSPLPELYSVTCTETHGSRRGLPYYAPTGAVGGAEVCGIRLVGRSSLLHLAANYRSCDVMARVWQRFSGPAGTNDGGPGRQPGGGRVVHQILSPGRGERPPRMAAGI